MVSVVPFEGVESIPGLAAVTDAAGDAMFLRRTGGAPIVIVACHSGDGGTTPKGALKFGRRFNPSDANASIPSGDFATMPIALAILRALTSRGVDASAVLSLVSRAYVDMNRSWEGQLGWNKDGATRFPDEIATPGGADLLAFKAAYYDSFQNAVREIATAIHPKGWLFDIHGQSNPDGSELYFFSGYGHYARADICYAGGDCLHARLTRQGFVIAPTSADPANEVRNRDNGRPLQNFMSGSAFGARAFSSSRDPAPFAGNVVPTEPHRLHAISFEIDAALRRGRAPERLEETGLRIGTAIHDALLLRGVLDRDARPSGRGDGASAWYALLG